MKRARSILDESFRYVPAVATSVADTWRRFGWRPTTEEERKKRPGGSIVALLLWTYRSRTAARPTAPGSPGQSGQLPTDAATELLPRSRCAQMRAKLAHSSVFFQLESGL